MNTISFLRRQSAGFLVTAAAALLACRVQAESGLVGWGASNPGQLTVTDYVPTPIVITHLGAATGKTFVGTAISLQHSLALSSDGLVFAWGDNGSGELGNNSTTSSLYAVAVDTSGVLAGKTVTQVVAEANNSYAVTSDGHVYAWGNNNMGQLGNNSTAKSSVPVAVDTSGALAGKTVVQVTAGNACAFALCSDGTVASWGWYGGGLLGVTGPLPNNALTPQSVTGALAGKTITKIATGSEIAIALDSTGKIYTWGYSYADGFNTVATDIVVPVAVDMTGVMAGDTIVDIATGGYSGYALGASGKVYAWGDGLYGQLGNGGNNNSSKPVLVDMSGALAGKTVVALSGETNNAFALDSNGKVYAWGDAPYVGVAGLNSAVTSPVAVDTGSSTITHFQSGTGFTTFLALADVPTFQLPAFISQPLAQMVTIGRVVTFTAPASGIPAPTYQWWRDNNPLTGATTDTLSFTVTQYDTAKFYCVATNWSGSITSTKAQLTATPFAVGDFDSNGHADLLWENNVTGDRAIWDLNGTTIGGFDYLAGIPTDWHMVGTGDFNNDLLSDIVWENTKTGDRTFWLMDGHTIDSFAYLAFVDPAWHIAATGDFDGDGNTDIIWENLSTGDRTIWYMHGTSIASFGYVAQVPAQWRIVGAADFDLDGHPDLLWENTVTGDRSLWLMNNLTILNFVAVANVPPAWHIAMIADLNSDGQPDLIWENTTTGDRAYWLMNGTTLSSNGYFALVPTDWHIAP